MASFCTLLRGLVTVYEAIPKPRDPETERILEARMNDLLIQRAESRHDAEAGT